MKASSGKMGGGLSLVLLLQAAFVVFVMCGKARRSGVLNFRRHFNPKIGRGKIYVDTKQDRHPGVVRTHRESSARADPEPP